MTVTESSQEQERGDFIGDGTGGMKVNVGSLGSVDIICLLD